MSAIPYIQKLTPNLYRRVLREIEEMKQYPQELAWHWVPTQGQDHMIGCLLEDDDDQHDYLYANNSKGELVSIVNPTLVGMFQDARAPTESEYAALGKLVYQSCRKNLYGATKRTFEEVAEATLDDRWEWEL